MLVFLFRILYTRYIKKKDTLWKISCQLKYDKTIMISKKTPFYMSPTSFFFRIKKKMRLSPVPQSFLRRKRTNSFPLIDPDDPSFLLKAATASELPSFLTASISAFPLPFFRYASPTKRPSIELFIRSMKPRMIPASLAAIICASGKGLLTQVKLSSK